MTKEEKIAKLKKRIDELQEVYAEDVVSSHHEPGQTKAMIDLLNKQLEDLQTQQTDDKGKTFVLESGKEKRKLTVVENNPDSTLGRISSDSQVGAQLLKLNLGETISIGPNMYKLVEIK